MARPSHPTPETHQDVLGLEVEVHDIVGVQVGKGVNHLPHERSRVVLAVRSLVHQPVEKLSSGGKLCAGPKVRACARLYRENMIKSHTHTVTHPPIHPPTPAHPHMTYKV